MYLRRRDGKRVRITSSRVDETDLVWSPDGETLAFASGGTIMLVDRDGRRLRRLLGR